MCVLPELQAPRMSLMTLKTEPEGVEDVPSDAGKRQLTAEDVCIPPVYKHHRLLVQFQDSQS